MNALYVRRRLLSGLSLCVLFWALLSPDVDAQSYFRVNPDTAVISGYDWPPYADVLVTSMGDELGAVQSDALGRWTLQLGEKPVAGQSIAAFDGESIRIHQITNLRLDPVTAVSVFSNTVSGTADPGSWVHVRISEHAVWRDVQADANGDWIADFSIAVGAAPEDAAFDLKYATHRGTASQQEGHGYTYLAWVVPPAPALHVHLHGNGLEGLWWPVGSILSVTINDEPYPVAPVVGQWMSWRLGVDPYIHRLQPGDQIHVTDGETEITHTVRFVEVTDLDADNNVLSGRADPEQPLVVVWTLSHAFEGTLPQVVLISNLVADAQGDWSADFTGAYNIRRYGSLGGVIAVDEADPWDPAGSTHIPASVRVPSIHVTRQYNIIQGRNWADGAEIEIRLNGVAYPEVAYADPMGEWWLFLDPDHHELAIGDQVEALDVDTWVEHVVTSLRHVDVDEALTRVTGEADPYSWVVVEQFNWHAEDSPSSGRYVQADEYGLWMVDFAVPAGDEPWDMAAVFDVYTGIEARQADDLNQPFGETLVHARILQPRFAVYVDTGVIQGWDWPRNESVTIFLVPDGEPERVLGVALCDEWGSFWFDPDDEIHPGQHVRVETATFERTHEIQNLWVWHVDRNANTVSGEAAPFAWLTVSIDGVDWERRVQAPDDGFWMVDFSAAPEGAPHAVWDIEAGTQGQAIQTDVHGNATIAEWRAYEATLHINLVRQEISGQDWPAFRLVRVYVGDDPDEPDWEGWTPVNEHGFLHMSDLPEEIGAGDIVAAETTTGMHVAAQHRVRHLDVLNVSAADNTMSGITEEFEWVDILIDDEPVGRLVQADENGDWFVDFNFSGDEEWEASFDIQKETRGLAAVFDEDGNSTEVSWRPDHPIMGIQPRGWNFDFVDVGHSVTQAFTITNTGKLALEILAVELVDGADLLHFELLEPTGAGEWIEPGGEPVVVAVVFAPTAAWGKAVRLQVSSNDEDVPVMDVRLYGTGRDAGAAQDHFESGLDALALWLDDGETEALLNANEFFGQALAADPDHYGAAIFRLLTRFVCLPYEEDVAEMLSAFGMSEEGRELWDWSAELPDPLPDELPSLAEVVDLLGVTLNGLIDEGLANLGRIPVEWPGSIIISPAHLPIDNEVQVDAGDVQMFQAVLHFLQGLLAMITAHDWNVEITDLLDEETVWSDLLDSHPDLAALTNVALFASAANSWIAAIDFYHTGSDLIRNETDYQHDDLIVFDPDQLELEQAFANALQQFRDSLTGTAADSFEVELAQFLDLDHFFQNPSNLRDLFFGAGVQGVLGDVVLYQIDRALDNIAGLDAAFVEILDPSAAPVLRNVEFDYGDVLMARAWLNGWKAFIHAARAYHMDDVHMLAWMEMEPFDMGGILADHEELLTIMDATQLAAASNAWAQALQAYVDGSFFLREEQATRANDVFAIWGNGLWLINGHVSNDESKFHALLQDLQASMTQPVSVMYRDGGGVYTFVEYMHLGALFGVDYVSRAHLPEFDADNRMIAGTFPDPTFTGVFPNLTAWHLAERLGLGVEDSDDDGLPDLWKDLYFPDTEIGPDDITPSGMTAYAAMRAGIDPHDPNGALDFVEDDAPPPEPGVMELRWRSVPYKVYAIESTYNLLDAASWQLEQIVRAGPGTTVYRDPDPSDNKYYRIRVIY